MQVTHAWVFPYLQDRSTVRKQKNPSSVSNSCLWLLGLVVVGQIFFLFFSILPTPSVTQVCSCWLMQRGDGSLLQCSSVLPKAATCLFQALRAHGHGGIRAMQRRVASPSAMQIAEDKHREAPPNAVGAEPRLGRTTRCRGWRCLQCPKSSLGTRQRFETTEKLSVFVPCHVSWMCQTRR